jgi:hypothetical protein
MDAEAEYNAAIEYLKTKQNGALVLSILTDVSKRMDLAIRSSELLKDNMMAQTALSFISADGSIEIINKNLVLVVYRMCELAKRFDALPLFDKMKIVFDILEIFHEEQTSWMEEYERRTEPVHDKKERRKRRKELFESLEESGSDLANCKAFLKGAVDSLLPQGSESLILPGFARMFVPKNYVHENLEKATPLCARLVASRVWKESLLFYIITFLFRDGKANLRMRETERVSCEASKEVFDKAERASTHLLRIFSAIEPSFQFFPKEESAQKAIDLLNEFFETFSLERLFLQVISLFSGANRTISTAKLENCIDAISGDPKCIAFLLKKLMRPNQPVVEISAKPALKDLLIVGFQGAMIETAVKEKAAQLVYEEIPLKVLLSTHRFVVSRAFDRLLYRTIQKFLKSC